MKTPMKTMLLSAAVSGLLGGTAVRLQAAQTSASQGTVRMTASQSNAGKLSINKVSFDDAAKHSCKGKNDCKGQGGCKASDNGCKAKNDCKGKGGCATDGSKPPQLAV